MDEQQAKRGGPSRFLWILVLLAVVVLWWYFRPESHHVVSQVDEAAEAATAPIEPDEILVDLRDDATPATIASIERDAGIQLALVDDTAAATKLYRARVDPDRREAVLRQLQARPEVEIAEPDFQMQLSPFDFLPPAVVSDAKRAPGPEDEGFPNDPLYK